MSKEQYPSVTGKQIVSALEKAGGIVKRTNGSHVIIEYNGKTVTVPVHKNKDTPEGTIKSIMRQAGLNKKEFYKLFSYGIFGVPFLGYIAQLFKT